MKRLPVEPHLTADQAHTHYRACRHPVEKVRWRAVWLLLRPDPPRSPAQVAGLVGLSAVTARDALRRWNARGPAGLADRRRGNGARPQLTDGQRAALFAALTKRHPDGGRWTGPKVARFVRDRWGVAVCPQTGWQWLRDRGFTLQVPRPSHPRAAGAAERAGKKLARAAAAAAGPPRQAGGGRGAG
jgi:transposase